MTKHTFKNFSVGGSSWIVTGKSCVDYVSVSIDHYHLWEGKLNNSSILNMWLFGCVRFAAVILFALAVNKSVIDGTWQSVIFWADRNHRVLPDLGERRGKGDSARDVENVEGVGQSWLYPQQFMGAYISQKKDVTVFLRCTLSLHGSCVMGHGSSLSSMFDTICM